MDVLRKIRSATLVEAIVATVIIVIIFIIAGLVLNNLLVNNFSSNTHSVRNRMYEIQYLIKNKVITLPYNEQFKNWDIAIKTEMIDNHIWLKAEAINHETTKTVIQSSLYE